MQRRDLLYHLAVAGGALGAASAFGFGPALALPAPQELDTLLPPAERAEGVLEIFLCGGVSQYESFYCVPEHGKRDRTHYHLYGDSPGMGEALTACGISGAPTQYFAHDAAGQEVHLGPFVAPLRQRQDVLSRLRISIVRHDRLRARGMWRVSGVLAPAGRAPFGWNAAACGAFNAPATDDPLGIDTYFGSIRGRRASVWDVERALRRGVEQLAQGGLGAAADGTISDADRAFAYLVALNLVEKVWLEVIGTPLTLAHHFPRTQVQRDVLERLTDGFVRARFSLRWLLLEIATSPAFNLRAPADGCGTPYALPRLFDPWTNSEQDPALRGNSAGDGVVPLSPRLLRRLLHTSLGWPMYPEYPAPDSEEETLALASGFFLRDAEPGRRGFDFQGRLAWEAAYGACRRLGERDFISELVERAAATPTAMLGDAMVVLYDRLLGEGLPEPSELALVEQLFAASLSSRDLDRLEAQLRLLCGNLVASPALLLGGLASGSEHPVPLLTAD